MAPVQTSEAAVVAWPTAPQVQHDVVIVGAGPAGLMLATCLAQMGVKPFIIDSQDASHHARGRGDALQCRTIEVMKSIGLGQPMIDEGVKMYTRTFWDMTVSPPQCTSRSDFFSPDIDCDDCYSLGIRQGLVESILERRLQELCGVQVQRGWSFDDATLQGQSVSIGLQSSYGERRQMQAKYLVGCDGGKSAVRRMLRDKHNVALRGDGHDSRWSAVDVVGLRSDFPDLRNLSILHGHTSTILIIPREPIEGKSCVRFYCQLPESDDEGGPSGDENKAAANPDLDDVVRVVKATFAPYAVEWDEVHWFTIYRVGQRLVSSFDVERCIFLAGDAAHLHSPKGGLGMNTSLLDAHNLAVKIALVERWGASRMVLDTYSQERRLVAEQLISMDRELIRLFSDHRNATPETTAALGAFQRKTEAYQSGTSIVYTGSSLVTPSETTVVDALGDEGLPRGLVAGARLLPATVTRHEDCNPVPVLDALQPFDGHFTVFLCLGHVTASAVATLLAHIARPGGLYSSMRDKSASWPQLLRLVAITLQDHRSLEVTHSLLPAMASPASPLAPSALYCDDVPCLSPYAKTPTAMTHPLHTKWKVDASTGALVVVRPDGHVGALTPSLHDWATVEDYFAQWLSPAAQRPF